MKMVSFDAFLVVFYAI